MERAVKLEKQGCSHRSAAQGYYYLGHPQSCCSLPLFRYECSINVRTMQLMPTGPHGCQRVRAGLPTAHIIQCVQVHEHHDITPDANG